MIEQYKQYFIKEELNNEIWKDVGGCKGYEDFKGLYEISNMGRLRSKYIGGVAGQVVRKVVLGSEF